MRKNIIQKVAIATLLFTGITTTGLASTGTSASAKTSNTTSTYKVVKGDTLTKIAKKKKTTVTKLKKLNKLKSSKIRVGQKLKYKGTIPTAKKKTTKKKIKKVSNRNADRYLDEGRKYLGTPYVWGGTTSRGLDCSGFIYRTLKDSGKNVTRLTSGGLYSKYKKISSSQAEAGDLVFFAEGGSRITHVAFVYGNGKILHSAGKKVQINNLNNGYWKQRVVGYARIN